VYRHDVVVHFVCRGIPLTSELKLHTAPGRYTSEYLNSDGETLFNPSPSMARTKEPDERDTGIYTGNMIEVYKTFFAYFVASRTFLVALSVASTAFWMEVGVPVAASSLSRPPRLIAVSTQGGRRGGDTGGHILPILNVSVSLSKLRTLVYKVTSCKERKP
jgi:hypothetical protein